MGSALTKGAGTADGGSPRLWSQNADKTGKPYFLADRRSRVILDEANEQSVLVLKYILLSSSGCLSCVYFTVVFVSGPRHDFLRLKRLGRYLLKHT